MGSICVARRLTHALSARIKVHRYCAFLDLPIFSAKHCDLRAKPAGGEFDQETTNSLSFCSYSPLLSNPTSSSASSSPPFPSSHSTPSSNGDLGLWATVSPGGGNSGFPFSSHVSSKISLQAALNVAQAFDDLPYPNPSGQQQPQPPPYLLSPTSVVPAPRTMPSFACCAMQCAYALLMVRDRARAAGAPTPLVAGLLGVLNRGLASISATLENYSSAFEALGGMRGE